MTCEGRRGVGRAGLTVTCAGQDGHAHQGDRGDGGSREGGGTPAAGCPDAAPHRVQPVDGAAVVDGVGLLVQGVAELVEPHHASSEEPGTWVSDRSWSVAVSASSTRSLASALAFWLFTVPTEQPSSRAVSASVRSSK